jgi:hypothetical protein
MIERSLQFNRNRQPASFWDVSTRRPPTAAFAPLGEKGQEPITPSSSNLGHAALHIPLAAMGAALPPTKENW